MKKVAMQKIRERGGKPKSPFWQVSFAERLWTPPLTSSNSLMKDRNSTGLKDVFGLSTRGKAVQASTKKTLVFVPLSQPEANFFLARRLLV